MDDSTGKNILDAFCYADLIKNLTIAKQKATHSNDQISEIPAIRKLLQDCIIMLSDGKNGLERMEKGCCTSSIIVTDLVSYEIGVIESFKHCSESNIIYGDSITNVKELLTDMFKRTSEMQTLYLNILEKVNFDFTIDGDLNLLLDALKHIWHATKAVHKASNKIMAINLKVYTSMSQKFSLELKRNIINDEPIDFVCAEIKKKVMPFQESSLKLLTYLMNILVKLCSFGRILESHNSLVELIIFLNSYWLPETQAVIKRELLPFVDQLVLISDEKFVKVFQSVCNGIIQNGSSSQKVSALYIAMLLLKRFIITPWEQQAFDIICIIFQMIKCSSFAMCDRSVHMYEPLLINIASVILVSECSLFEKVEKLLIHSILNIEYWPALFSCDLWIIITRYLSPSMCNVQFLKLAKLFEKLSGLPSFTQCPQHIYMKMLLKRHFSLINDKKQIVNSCPQFNMENLKSAVGILHVPTLSKYNRYSELIKIIDLLPFQKNIDHLNDDISHLWSCVKDEHPPHFMCALIEVSIKSKLLLQKVIPKVPEILRSRLGNETTEVKRFKLQLIRAIIMLSEPLPEVIIMEVFLKYLHDPHPLVQQWTVETIVYFASVTGNRNKLMCMFNGLPQNNNIITNYLEMKINRATNYDDRVTFFEQLSLKTKCQRKKLNTILDQLKSNVDCLNNIVSETPMSANEIKKLNECSSILNNILCLATQSQI